MLQLPDAQLDALVLSTTNEEISLPALTGIASIRLSSNGGCLTFENLTVRTSLYLNAKNGDISGTIAGRCEESTVQAAVKKGESNLPEHRSVGAKTLGVSCNNGDVHIEFLNE